MADALDRLMAMTDPNDGADRIELPEGASFWRVRKGTALGRYRSHRCALLRDRVCVVVTCND